MKEEKFEELYKKACSAFNWQSMEPERRARGFINEFQNIYNSDIASFYLEQVPDEEVDRYTENFFKRLEGIIASEGRCASTMVTGAAKFNVQRNRKKIDAAMNKYNDFNEWRDKAITAIKRKMKEARGEAGEVEDTLNYIKEMTDMKHWYSAQYIASHLERKAYNGKVECVKAAIEYLKDLRVRKDLTTYRESEVDNAEEQRKDSKPFLTQRSKVWDMQAIAEKHASRLQEQAQRENVEVEHTGYKIVVNYAENRLQILFDDKPERDEISNLKHNGFHWSPRNKAWQRQLNRDTLWTVKRMGYDDNLCNQINI